MTRLIYPVGGVGLAAALAGPIFVSIEALAHMYAMLPAAIPVSPEMVVALPLLFFAAPIGFLIAILPCGIGTMAMVRLSRQSWMARTALAWMVAGGALPLLALVTSGAGTPLKAALAVTGGACALICRSCAERRG